MFDNNLGQINLTQDYGLFTDMTPTVEEKQLDEEHQTPLLLLPDTNTAVLTERSKVILSYCQWITLENSNKVVNLITVLHVCNYEGFSNIVTLNLVPSK